MVREETDREGGERRPKGATEGKATPDTTGAERKDGRDAELTNRLNGKPAQAVTGAKVPATQGSRVVYQKPVGFWLAIGKRQPASGD